MSTPIYTTNSHFKEVAREMTKKRKKNDVEGNRSQGSVRR